MEYRIHKLLLIVGTSIAFETIVFALHQFLSYRSPFILFSFFVTYTLLLFFFKRAGVFDKISFPQALLYALLISIPVIVLPPALGLFFQPIIRGQMPDTGQIANIIWIPLAKSLALLSLIKFISASIIAFVFCTRLESRISDEKELRLYGEITQGVIFRKWKHRHMFLVKIEYHINGNRYETDAKVDRKNIFSENDKVTILYSTRYPSIALIKELADFQGK